MRSHYHFLIIVLLVVTLCRAQDVAKMDELVASSVKNGEFMGSVLVARGDQVLLNKGYGLANLEWNVVNTPTTKFRLGSLTKQFTAASILLLAERGKLQIDDPVKKHLPHAPGAWDKVTIFHLLTHTSGIPSFTDFPDYGPTKMNPSTPEQLLGRFRDKPLRFTPGEKWEYSNSGYVLLGYVIENVSGQSYENFVNQNIFVPLGMKDTGYDSARRIIPFRAAGYERSGDGPVNTSYIDMSIPFSAGALYSTTEDLLRWQQGLYGGKLLKAESLEKMVTPFQQQYAFGLSVKPRKGSRAYAHGGGIEGFSTFLAYFPDERCSIIVLGNLSGPAPGQLARRLADLTLQK